MPNNAFVAVACAGCFALLAGCGDDSSAPVGGGAEGGQGGQGAAPPVGGESAIDADIVRYDITADIATLKATIGLELEVNDPGGTCFSVGSEVPASAASFDDVAAATIEHTGDTLVVCSSELLEPASHQLAADVTLVEKTFHGLDVGFSTHTSLSGSTFTYLLSWVGGCDHFGPCNDAPDAMASFTFAITHPSGTTVLCPGALSAGDTLTQCQLTATPAPTYSAFAFAADPDWVGAPLLSRPGVDVTLYEVPGGTLRESYDVQLLGDFLDWVTGRFGPLPYGSDLRLAGGPTVWLGFEHPSNIILQEELDVLSLPYTDGTLHVTMHEITHQWAGDAATIATPQDFAWKEAIAEYIAYVFEDEALPPAAGAATRDYWDSISTQASYYVRPLDEPPPNVEDFYGDVYGPGPMVLFLQLEALLGRDAVLTGIADFLAGGGARSVDDLRLALENASGESLGVYFDTWVFGTGAPVWPKFAVVAQDNGDGTVTVTVQQTQPGGTTYPCQLEVDLVGATSTSTATVEFPLDGSDALPVTVSFAEPVLSTEIDPRHRVVDTSPGVAPATWPVFIF